MPDDREHPLRTQAEAVAVITTRIAHDPDFAEEFIGIVERGDKETLEAFARSAGVSMDEVVVIPVENGVCVCKGRVCICIIYRDENA
jgi:hypothetical protein